MFFVLELTVTYSDSARAKDSSILDEQGRAEPLCTKIEGANRDISEGKSDLCPRSVLFLRGPTRSGEQANFVGRFSETHRTWTTGCWLARRLHHLKAPTTMDLGSSILFFLMTYGLEKLGTCCDQS